MHLMPLDEERQALVKEWQRHISDVIADSWLAFHQKHPDLYGGWRLSIEAGDGNGQHMESVTQSLALFAKGAEHQWREKS